GRWGQHQYLRPRGQRPGRLRLRHGEREAGRARVPVALGGAPQLPGRFSRVAEERDRLLDEALGRLVAEDDVEVVVAPARALHHRLHGGIEEAEGGGEEVTAVAAEGAVEEAAAQLARLRAGAEAAADRVAPLRGIAPKLARTQPAPGVVARLEDDRPSPVADDQAGDRLPQLLHRPRLPADRERGPLTGRDQNPLGLPAADQRVAHVERVDQAVAGVEQVEDTRVARAERVGDEARRGGFEAVARDASVDEQVDLERIEPRAPEGLLARRRGELARLHLR